MSQLPSPVDLCGLGPLDARADRLLADVASVLREAFGCEPELWIRAGTWLRWGTTSLSSTGRGELGTDALGSAAWNIEPVAHGNEPDALGSLGEMLEAAASRCVPILEPRGEGRYLLAVPCWAENGCPLVAVGVVDSAPEETLRRVGALVVGRLSDRRELVERRRELDACLRQINEDFEEIHGLLDLSRHLEYCELSRSVAEVAERLLPLVRRLVRAETLVYCSCRQAAGVSWQATGGEVSGAGPDPVEAMVGVGPVAEHTCRGLVERYGTAALARPVVVNHLDASLVAGELPGVESFLLVSAGRAGACRGWLLAVNRRLQLDGGSGKEDSAPPPLGQDEFGTVEAGMMEAAASVLASHERNVQVHQDGRSLLVDILRTLAGAIDARDRYSRGHSDRVALIARHLGEELRLGAAEQEQLYLGGLLHDIGMIAVPLGVVLKPGRLTADEFAQIRRHPGRGYAILRHLQRLNPLPQSVLYHHEHYDGSGYPEGRARELIPLAARIIAVADAFDAMSSPRPYRESLPPRAVSKAFRQGAGSQWDPAVVEAFLRTWDDVCQLRAECIAQPMPVPALIDARYPPEGTQEHGLVFAGG